MTQSNAQPHEPTPGQAAPPPFSDPLAAPNVQEWERTYAMWIHLGCLIAALIASASMGIGAWAPGVTALAMWLTKREKSPFVDDHGKEALNFQITLLIYGLICVLLWIACIGLVLLIPLVVFAVVTEIIAAVKASKGSFYRYPMCIRLIS